MTGKEKKLFNTKQRQNMFCPLQTACNFQKKSFFCYQKILVFWPAGILHASVLLSVKWEHCFNPHFLSCKLTLKKHSKAESAFGIASSENIEEITKTTKVTDTHKSNSYSLARILFPNVCIAHQSLIDGQVTRVI